MTNNNIEQVEDIKNMPIYEKISNIQLNLLGHKFETKKGYHGEFIPLKEMLPPVLKECRKYRLTLYFTATTDQFMLKLMSWDGKEEFSARVRLPELTRDEKDEGKKITYLKRYLLMNTFMILEESVEPGEEIEMKDMISYDATRDDIIKLLYIVIFVSSMNDYQLIDSET